MHVRTGRLLTAAVGIVAVVVTTGTASAAALPASAAALPASAAALPASPGSLPRPAAAPGSLPRPAAAPGSLPRPAADHPEIRGADAPIRGAVRGLTGAAAAGLVGEAATRFEALTR